MEKKEDFLENFKTAIISTVKSISNIDDIQVAFGNQNFDKDKLVVKLPELENTNNKINYTKTRAIADSEALKIRYSNNEIYKNYEPTGGQSKKLYSIAEKIRYEKIGSLRFKGIKENINSYYGERLNNLDLKKNENKILEAFENYLRVNILGLKNNKNTEKEFKSLKKTFDVSFKKKLLKINESLKNQVKFNALISEIISEMDIEEGFDSTTNDQKDNLEKNQEGKQQESENSDEGKQDENQEMSIESGVPNVDNLASENDNDSAESLEIEESSAANDSKKDSLLKFGDKKYKAYTEEFDEIIMAEELENEDELNRMRQTLDQQLLQLKNFISKLANKLQRKLLAK